MDEPIIMTDLRIDVNAHIEQWFEVPFTSAWITLVGAKTKSQILKGEATIVACSGCGRKKALSDNQSFEQIRINGKWEWREL